MRKWISKRVIALVMTGVLSVCLITPAMAEELISNNSFESLEAESVSLGGFTSGAITKDGGLWMWGSNSGGQLGDESMQKSTAPVFIKGNMAKVCLGDSHMSFLMTYYIF